MAKQPAEQFVEASSEALTESGNASGAAIQELTKAYQELATKECQEPDRCDAGAGRREEPDGVHGTTAETDQGGG